MALQAPKDQKSFKTNFRRLDAHGIFTTTPFPNTKKTGLEQPNLSAEEGSSAGSEGIDRHEKLRDEGGTSNGPDEHCAEILYM
eukprot:2166644-Rhodomonas_salina.2